MSGILFFKTKDRENIIDFYHNKIGMDIWLEKENCTVFRQGNLLLGFCMDNKIDNQGMISFFFQGKKGVNIIYDILKDCAVTKPQKNTVYQIYNFFAKDPEGRDIECFTFLDNKHSNLTGDEILLTRRSVRDFEHRMVGDKVLWQIFEECRYAPTSKNSQPYYYIVIKDRKRIELLASIREDSSAPIAQAPIAVAICSDPSISKRYVQDGCIAAYHFMLSTWYHNLGTCWIGGMDRDDVKEILNIPKEHYVVTVTPLGYPTSRPELRPRRLVEEFVKFLI
ncbi:MAG: hypothetical protein B5M53_11865 [Candidatus Cloacimonas sp. 4484_209]|nr:MAG: hypothetical protein B5M53_11865 [Candidatus Cloacimonas sp. 4484_209]